MNLDEALKLARGVAELNKHDTPGEGHVATDLARAVLAMAPVVEAANKQHTQSCVLALTPTSEREQYIEAHEAWIRATDATERALSTLSSKVPHGE